MSWMIKKAFNCCAGNDDSNKEKVFSAMNWTVNEAKAYSYDCSSHSKTNSNTKDNTNKNSISSFTFSKKTSNPKHEITFNNDSSMSSISSISFASSSKSNLSSIQFNYEEEGKLKAPRTKFVQE